MQNAVRSDVHILDPDRSLQIKIGVRDLDQVFRAETIKAAEGVIEKSSDRLLSDSLAYLERLQKDYRSLSREPSQRRDLLPKIADTAFRIKAETGMARYTLISEVAKSLQLHAEKAVKDGLYAKNYLILDWHVSSLDHLFSLRVKGVGGPTGEAILQEMRRINPAPEDDVLPAAAPRSS